MKHFNIRVKGKVQGVFFRKNTQEKARQLGLKGFVQNEQDGSVYIEAEGNPADLERLLEWTREGPPRAGVQSVDYEERAVVGFDKFEIRE